MCNTAGSVLSGPLEFRNACCCAGTGCGGHLEIARLDITDWTPIGWQGPVQHTWTRACDGLHEPGPCPERQPPVTVTAWL